MSALYTDNRWTFTATASSQQADFPASNLNVIDNHPLLYSWRSNNQTTQQTIILDIGASHVMENPTLLNTNFPLAGIQYSPLGANYFDFTSDPGGIFDVTYNSALLTIARNPFGFYRNRIALGSGTGQYVRIVIPAQATTDGMPWFEIGMVWLANGWFTLPDGPEAGLRQTPKRPYLRVGSNVATAGPWGSDEEWQASMRSTQTSVWTQFILDGAETPHLMFKNLGNSAEVGIFRFRDYVSITRNGLSVAVNPTFEEMV